MYKHTKYAHKIIFEMKTYPVWKKVKSQTKKEHGCYNMASESQPAK